MMNLTTQDRLEPYPPPTGVTEAVQHLALALWKVKKQQPEEARSHFREAIQLDPENAGARVRYAAFLVSLTDAEARKELEGLLDYKPDTAFQWLVERPVKVENQAYGTVRALLLTRLGNRHAARQAFEELLRQDPNNGQLYIELASLQETVDPEAAQDSYKHALEIDRERPDWQAAYGLFLSRGPRRKEALPYLRRALEYGYQEEKIEALIAELESLTQQEQEAREKAAWAYYLLEEQKDLDGSAESAAKALESSPECGQAHYVLAKVLQEKGKLTEAESHYRRALELEPDSQEYIGAWHDFQEIIQQRRARARALVERARATKATSLIRALLEEALAILPDEPEAHLAYVELLNPAPPEAEERLKIILKNEPGNQAANRRYAALLREQERTEEADAQYQKGLKLLPGDEGLILDYSDWLAERGGFRFAEKLLKWGLCYSPGNAQMTARLALALVSLGRRSEASPLLLLALEALPENPVLHREYAVFLREAQELSKSEEEFRRALDQNPDDPLALAEYADLLVQHQRFQEASRLVDKARRLPDEPEVERKLAAVEEHLQRYEQVEQEMALAEYFWEEGQADEAQEAFKRALAIDPGNILVREEYTRFHNEQGDLANEIIYSSTTRATHSQDEPDRLQLNEEKQFPEGIPVQVQSGQEPNDQGALSSHHANLTLVEELPQQGEAVNLQPIPEVPTSEDRTIQNQRIEEPVVRIPEEPSDNSQPLVKNWADPQGQQRVDNEKPSYDPYPHIQDMGTPRRSKGFLENLQEFLNRLLRYLPGK